MIKLYTSAIVILALNSLNPGARASEIGTTATLNGNGSTVLITGAPAEVVYNGMSDANETYTANANGLSLTIRQSHFLKCNLYKGKYSCGFNVNRSGEVSQF